MSEDDELNLKEIKDFLKRFFEVLGIEATYDIAVSNESLDVTISAKEEYVGLLIGSKGKNIYSLQRILNVIFNRGDGKSIIVDVDNWRKAEEQRIRDLARKTVERVKQTGEPQNLYNLSPFQRKIIHTYLASEEGIKTESQGEGEERFLVISPK